MACLLPVSAGVLYFDDIPNSGEAPMPSGYGGFTWDSNFYVESWTEFNSSYGNTYLFPSMSNVVYNGYGVLDVTMSGSPFIFNGADFSGWDEDNGIVDSTATSVSVTGYLGGNLVGTASVNLPADTFVWLNANMGPVDELVFTSSAQQSRNTQESLPGKLLTVLGWVHRHPPATAARYFRFRRFDLFCRCSCSSITSRWTSPRKDLALPGFASASSN